MIACARRLNRPILLAGVLLTVIATGVAAAASTTDLADPTLPERARTLAIGDRLRISGVVLDPGSPPATLDLERFRAFAPDARVVVHSDAGVATLPAPTHTYLRGTISGRSGSQVVLTVVDTGEVHGVVAMGGRYWLVTRATGQPSPRLDEVTEHPSLDGGTRRFSCDVERLAGPPPPRPDIAEAAAALGSGERSPRNGSHTVRLAVETDHEYYQQFGSVASAVTYAGDLFAYASGTFTSEVGAELLIQSVSLWTTTNDPWMETTSGCCLFEFGRHWNTHMGHVPRTVAHFLSGKAAGGGISWTGVLCSQSFSYDISGWGCALSPAVDLYGGGYGFSGNITGGFSVSNPSVVWDIYVVSHEIGHNFNTGHTHCYSPPVDQCYGSEAGCYDGPASLPCPTPGAGCGTIMSYCHLLGPGVSNISLTLGLGHPWGTDPWRVPTVMSSYVATVAAADPFCLAPIAFADSFETGDTSMWSSTVP